MEWPEPEPLTELLDAQPYPDEALPRIPRLLYADATPEALAHALATGWPSGGALSAEAGAVFGAHGMGQDTILRNLARRARHPRRAWTGADGGRRAPAVRGDQSGAAGWAGVSVDDSISTLEGAATVAALATVARRGR